MSRFRLHTLKTHTLALRRDEGAFNLGQHGEGTGAAEDGGGVGARRRPDNNKEIGLTGLFSVETPQ